MLYKKYFKRVLDFSLSLLILIFFSPLIIFILIILALTIKTNPIFFQIRPGKNSELFKIFKFKTMSDAVDENGILLPDKDRITKIGTFLRKTSLDELPQLFNVLNGDMSLIGPRPLLVEYLPLYNEFQMKRHQVKPGITGWAQINGRNLLTWHQKFDYDVYYAQNVNFTLDFTIICKTIYKFLNPEGISSKTSVSMEDFLGND
jgi:undecaprenyl phosphate N,N'-diacetylbacillosamine 1-phosphate transferase